MPVVNENDAIANDELRYGDNDRIAALIANSVGADVLVLLTDMDGVFTADPRRDPSATLIPYVKSDDPLLSISAADSGGSGRGSGGMASKLVAARMASWSGIRSVIARASRRGVLAGSASDELVGTTFAPHERTLPARKLWIAFAAEVAGSVHVDAGAQRALTDRPNSLLPAGVAQIDGSFEPGQVVDVVGPAGVGLRSGDRIDRSNLLCRRFLVITRARCPQEWRTRWSTVTISSCLRSGVVRPQSAPGQPSES